jgi:hypothetical protein
MKYLSLIVFVIALAWTWHLVHSDNPVSFETHSSIQEKLATLITETIQAKRPTATDIVIQKVWTENMSATGDRVKALFVYSFKDNSGEAGPITSEIRGEGFLERQPDDGSGNDRWVLTKVFTSSDSIQFDDATIVTASSDGSDSATTETTSPEAKTPETVTPAAAPQSPVEPPRKTE